MRHAAARDRTCVQLLLDAERQKRQNVQRVITDLRRGVSHHSSSASSVKFSLHTYTLHAYDLCCHCSCPKLPDAFATEVPHIFLILIHTLGRITPLYNMTCSLYLASLDHSLKVLRRDDTLSIFNRIGVPFLVHLYSKPSSPLLSVNVNVASSYTSSALELCRR